MNDEERVRAYVRGRADVPVPGDLRVPDPVPRQRWGAASSLGRAARLAAALVAIALVAIGVIGTSPRDAVPGQSSSPSAGLGQPTASTEHGSTAPASSAPDAVFPAQVAGLPVLTVAHAIELLGSGRLDGQVVAVGGYYNAFYPSCPAPGRYIGPLEDWCSFAAFTDTVAGAQLCLQDANGMTCQGPAGMHLAPFFMTETSGDANAWLSGGATGEPAVLVLIGHAGDPRQWQCTSAAQAACANAFVVDRVAWADGHDVAVAAPQTGNLRSGTPITPKLTLAQVADDAGLGARLLTGAAFRAGDIATVDPRWNLAGDSIVWLVRSVASATAPIGGEERPATVSLVDDATGAVLGRQSLKVDAAYRPARLWQMATVHGPDCCTGTAMAFSRVTTSTGTVIHDGLVSGGESETADTATFGGGYGSPPLVLPAGSYTISTWLASYDNGVMGAPSRTCSESFTLQPLADIALNADFAPGRACTFGPATMRQGF